MITDAISKDFELAGRILSVLNHLRMELSFELLGLASLLG